MSRVVEILPFLTFFLVCVSLYEAITVSPSVAWLEVSRDRSTGAWVTYVMVLFAYIWLLALARTPVVRVVFALLVASLVLHRVVPFFDEPAPWLGPLHAVFGGVACILSCRAFWLHRQSSKNAGPRGALPR